ncbi:Iron-binding zinc finger CDGSH type [compost metagenome]
MVAKPQVQADAAKAGDGALTVSCSKDGSLAVTGSFDLVDAKGAIVASGNAAWLCRCGGSANKPFCDGTHKKIGFKAS